MKHWQVETQKDGFGGQKRGEAERSEAEPSECPPNSGPLASSPAPHDTEVRARNVHRRFSPSYKARIIREADMCTSQGEIGALLRREGLYSSQLSHWRREYSRGGEAALEDNKRGRKPAKNPLDEENSRLRSELERTKLKLRQAEMIIEFQKNLCEMLEISPAGIGTEARG